MEKPFAITLDVGSSLAPTRPAAGGPSAPCTSTGSAVQRRLPRRREHPALALRRRGGRRGYERAWRQIMEDNPFPAIMGRVCYHPCETACNRGQLDEAVGHQLGRALPRRRGDQARLDGRAGAEPTGKRVLVVGAGPPGSRPRTTWPGSARGDDHDAGLWPAG